MSQNRFKNDKLKSELDSLLEKKAKKYSEGSYFSVSLRQNKPPLLSLTSIKKTLYYSGKFLFNQMLLLALSTQSHKSFCFLIMQR